jgi:tellurite methyltransferase
MSLTDKQKWDKKYESKPQLLKPRLASAVLQDHIEYCVGKQALELACGAGRNTLYLAKEGFFVDAMDIAQIAIDSLSDQAKSLELTEYVSTHLCDLEHFTPLEGVYDLVVMTNYLDRALLHRVKDGLKKDALCVVETYMQDEINTKEIGNQDNLLKKDELKEIFSDGFELLFYDEYDNETHEIYVMKKQAVVVKKI